MVAFVVGLVGALGCSSTPADEDASCPIGREGCACTSGGACDGSLICASSLCVDPSGAQAGPTTGAGGTAAGSSVGSESGGQAPPAILLGHWHGAANGWPRDYTFREDWTCNEVGSDCTFGLTRSAELPTLTTPWLIQEHRDCCLDTFNDSGAFSLAIEVAAIDSKGMTTVEQSGTAITYVALTRQ